MSGPTPPGLWCPFATHRPIPEAWTQPAITVRAAIVHSAGGHGELYGWWMSDASHGLESSVFIADDQTGHGFVDGEIVQYMGVGIKADANGEANSFATSIETASSVGATERWTPAQAAALVRFLDWHATVTGTPRRLMATPTDTGIAWHVQFGAPGPWTKVRGKVCPGPARVRQLVDEVIPAVARGAKPRAIAPFPGVIRPGDRGPRVAEATVVAKLLGGRGFASRPYRLACSQGPGKVRFWKRWQRSHGLVPDGIVGPATWAKADEVLAGTRR